MHADDVHMPGRSQAFAQCQSSGHAHSDVRAPTVGVFREQDEEEEEDEEPGAAERCVAKDQPKIESQNQFKKKTISVISAAFGFRRKTRNAALHLARNAAGRRRCGTSCRQHTRGATVPSTDRCLTPQQRKKLSKTGTREQKNIQTNRARTSSLARGGLLPTEPDSHKRRAAAPRANCESRVLRSQQQPRNTTRQVSLASVVCECSLRCSKRSRSKGGRQFSNRTLSSTFGFFFFLEI